MNKEEVTLYVDSMNVEEAISEVQNALAGYSEDCIGSEEYEGARILLDKAWDIVLNEVNND